MVFTCFSCLKYSFICYLLLLIIFFCHLYHGDEHQGKEKWRNSKIICHKSDIFYNKLRETVEIFQRCENFWPFFEFSCRIYRYCRKRLAAYDDYVISSGHQVTESINTVSLMARPGVRTKSLIDYLPFVIMQISSISLYIKSRKNNKYANIIRSWAIYRSSKYASKKTNACAFRGKT